MKDTTLKLVTIDEYEQDHKAHVLLVTRDETGKRSLEDITIDKFKPYFYAPSPTGNLVAIDGTPVKKLEFESYNQVVPASHEYDRSFECDVHYTTRYLIDCVPTIEKTNFRIQYTDIEKDIVTNQLISIAVYDTFLKKCIAFVWRKDLVPTQYDKSYKFPSGFTFNTTVHVYNSRKALLSDYIKFVKQTDPDIMTGWFFIKYDMKEIFDEIKAAGLRPNELSPIGRAYLIGDQVGKHEENIAIKGRILWDMLKAYSFLQPSRLPSKSLEAIAQKELGEGKHKHRSFKDIWNYLDELIEYNCKDAMLVYRIDQKKKLLDYYDTIRRFVGCDWSSIFAETLLWDCYLLRKCHNNVVLPTKVKINIDTYKGATVVQPTHKGIQSNILLTDFMRLYPSAIITFNMSPETLVRNETPDPAKHYILPNGIAFKKQPMGLLPTVLLELLELRIKTKKEMKTFKVGSSDYETLDQKQTAIKVLMNALYGAMGYFNFRLATREIAESTAYVARLALAKNIDILKALGYEIHYGDTDSLFAFAKSSTLPEMIAELTALVETINFEINSYFKSLGADKCHIQTEGKAIYKNLMMAERKSGVGLAKKRYAGLRYWVEGQTLDLNSDEALEIKGFEQKRSDTSQLSRDLQKELFRLLLDGANKADIKECIQRRVHGIKTDGYDLEYIGISKGIKDLDSYEIDNPHRRGSLYSNAYLGTRFGVGDKPKIVYVSQTGKYPRTDVVAFDESEQVPKDFYIDTGIMIDKTIVKKVEHILDAANISIQEVMSGTSSLEDFF
jgi:DNA polymerase elongation subunit (family B)